ncbi:MAG: hypothetical protein Q9169_005272 [Polycauliona sp. 2 TL-2023]
MFVKFSFLFLFRSLVQRIRALTIYWWIVTGFNVAVLGYGLSVYYVACPYAHGPNPIMCNTPAGQAKIMRHSVAQTVLDLLVLYIPVRLIWTIQVKWTTKFVLALSLCLTVVMILVTIIRISGIKAEGLVDQVWETYFIIVAAEVGVILTTVSAFRTLYVSRQNKNQVGAQKSPGQWAAGYSSIKSHLKRVFVPSVWQTRSKSGQTPEGPQLEGHNGAEMENLPDIPRAQMTGIRTFIRSHGKGSRVMESQATQDNDDTWPFQSRGMEPHHQV